MEFTIITTLKRKATNRKVTPLKAQTIKTRGSKKIGTQSRRSTTLEGLAAQSKKAINVENNPDENDEGTEEAKMAINVEDNPDENDEGRVEANMALLRKIDITSFLAYLLGYIIFNCYYWANMIGF